MKYDIFIAHKSPTLQPQGSWHCYKQAVSKTESNNLVSYLESGGERVLVCRHGKTLGKFVYETA
jgi:hypothetical protein